MYLYLQLVVLIGALYQCLALPVCNGVTFYHSMPCYYRAKSIPMTQRIMYVQYMRPAQGRVHASNDGLSTFVSSDAIGGEIGAFVKDTNEEDHQHKIYGNVENQSKKSIQGAVSIAQSYPEIPLQSKKSMQGAVSIAEAYPELPFEDVVSDHNEDEPVINAIAEIPEYEDANPFSNELDINGNGKVPKDFSILSQESDETTQNHSDELTERSVTVTQEPLDVTTGVISSSSPFPVIAGAYIPPRKKIRVVLEPPTEDSDEHSYEPVSPKIARPQPPPTRPPGRQPEPKQPLPSGTFFPINFGGTSGGAIAIANSFSTGDSGSATSHATAYGSPSRRSVSKKLDI